MHNAIAKLYIDMCFEFILIFILLRGLPITRL